MNYKYIIYFTQSQMYLFSARTRVKSIEVAKKFSSLNSAKQAVEKSLWSDEKYTIIEINE